MHVHTHTDTHGPACGEGPRGVPLSCQSGMDEEAALHSKGLWGNTTNMTHTNTHTLTQTLSAHKYSMYVFTL